MIENKELNGNKTKINVW